MVPGDIYIYAFMCVCMRMFIYLVSDYVCLGYQLCYVLYGFYHYLFMQIVCQIAITTEQHYPDITRNLAN